MSNTNSSNLQDDGKNAEHIINNPAENNQDIEENEAIIKESIRNNLRAQLKKNLINSQQLTFFQQILLFFRSFIESRAKIINQYKLDNFNDMNYDVSRAKVDEIMVNERYAQYIREKETKKNDIEMQKKQSKIAEKQFQKKQKEAIVNQKEIEDLIKEIIRLKESFSSGVKFAKDKELDDDDLFDLDFLIKKTFEEIEARKSNDNLYEYRVFLEEKLNNQNNGIKKMLEDRTKMVNYLINKNKHPITPTIDLANDTRDIAQIKKKIESFKEESMANKEQKDIPSSFNKVTSYQSTIEKQLAKSNKNTVNKLNHLKKMINLEDTCDIKSNFR